jgi:peroxiredoxin Q/BCP
VVDKSGKVLAAEPGSPAGTVAVVKKLVGGGAGGDVKQTEDADAATTAAEVADTAAKVDG